MPSTLLWVVNSSGEGDGDFHVCRSLASAKMVSTWDAAEDVFASASPRRRLSDKGRRIARMRARELAAAGGVAAADAGTGILIYSRYNDEPEEPFEVDADVRAGDTVWFVTYGDNNIHIQVVGVWPSTAKANAAMQIKVDYMKAQQQAGHDTGGGQYNLDHFPIGEPWHYDGTLLLFEVEVE